MTVSKGVNELVMEYFAGVAQAGIKQGIKLFFLKWDFIIYVFVNYPAYLTKHLSLKGQLCIHSQKKLMSL